jgi:hypothetical protein
MRRDHIFELREPENFLIKFGAILRGVPDEGGHPWPSVAIRGHPWPSEAIRGYLWYTRVS